MDPLGTVRGSLSILEEHFQNRCSRQKQFQFPKHCYFLWFLEHLTKDKVQKLVTGSPKYNLNSRLRYREWRIWIA